MKVKSDKDRAKMVKTLTVTNVKDIITIVNNIVVPLRIEFDDSQDRHFFKTYRGFETWGVDEVQSFVLDPRSGSWKINFNT